MAKQIIAWCDSHLLTDEQVVGEQLIISIDGQERAIDLCEDHIKELVEPLRSLLNDIGQPTSTPARIKPAATTGAFECPMPSCSKSYSGREGLRKHLDRVHDTTLTDVEARLGGSVADALNESENAYPCPDCTRRFQTPQGVGAHRARTHGYVSPHTNKQSA